MTPQTPTPGQPLSDADVKPFRSCVGEAILGRQERLHKRNDLTPAEMSERNLIDLIIESVGEVGDYDGPPHGAAHPLDMSHPHAPVSRPAGEGEREAREELARLIDPEAFVPMEDVIGMRKAYALADKIIARTGYDGVNWKAEWEAVSALRIAEHASLLRPAAPDGGGGEDLAGKLKAIRDKFLIPTPDKDHTDYAVMTRCIAALQPGVER